MTILGITGHRSFADTAVVAGGIDAVLARFKPHSIVSPLAEGADRLAVQRALALGAVRLIVPLPLSEAEYLEDFATQESRDEFQAFLARAERVVVMPPAADRRDAYAAVGHWVLKHCDVLLAVWDGQPPKSHAGTGAIVARARAQGHPLAWVDAVTGSVTYEKIPEAHA